MRCSADAGHWRGSAPTTAGLGSRLIKGVLSHELGGRVTLEYGIDGVSCRMQIPAEHWTAERGSV